MRWWWGVGWISWRRKICWGRGGEVLVLRSIGRRKGSGGGKVPGCGVVDLGLDQLSLSNGL